MHQERITAAPKSSVTSVQANFLPDPLSRQILELSTHPAVDSLDSK
ncbi:hypothetical protein SDRG_10846 [Saprolegnia diclina VS20]|uniref:Uncharacterized protein n=1 Tax=Saprolegnia diclina (strain VS20) TaxID=1156394 RepID=T0RH90_SAPDV|nr:hypothetical protein SDRG_10846 [Saprolegnia diclina VS20]EQC31683.1 hypothetical protein SDRG_10846 [Saprolegnia diclina VS20]|eukprot:XP_008615082.1 hypothetical protein SDRG_10846 [Saprolegnia diclina VS20]